MGNSRPVQNNRTQDPCARAYGDPMHRPLDDATSSFLQAAADDLQAQLWLAGVVEQVSVDAHDSVMTIVAAVRVGGQMVELRGSGQGRIDAYADLRRTAPEGVLVSTFADYLNA